MPRRPDPVGSPRLYVAEPRNSYASRRALVVDASVVAAALFGEEQDALAAAMMQLSALMAPQLIDFEIGNVALKKRRSGNLSDDELRGALEDFVSLDLARYPVDLNATLELAQRHALSAYDAAYLWLAEAMRAPLLTFDEKLANAARVHLGDPPGDAP